MYSEFNYKWNLTIEKRIIMLMDAPRMEYLNKKGKKKEKKEETKIVSKGSLLDFFGDSAGKIKKK